MAFIVGYSKPLDFSNLGFSISTPMFAKYGFDDNKNVSYLGVTYQDTYTLADSYFGNTIYMFGKDIVLKPGGMPKSGTVQALLVSTGTDLVHTDLFEIRGIRVPLAKLGEAILSSSKADDMALIKSALSGNDDIRLSIADDRFSGFGGNDKILGNSGNDTLKGGLGNDFLDGGPGKDTLFGEAGRDKFIFSLLDDSGATPESSDQIVGFEHKIDKINLSAIDANNLTEGDDAFNFIGAQAFHGVAGELHVERDASHRVTLLSGDVNGDAVADFMISLNGLVKLTPMDFVL